MVDNNEYYCRTTLEGGQAKNPQRTKYVHLRDLYIHKVYILALRIQKMAKFDYGDREIFEHVFTQAKTL